MPLVRRTRATLRKAEFGFFGVVVFTMVHTPRLNGDGKCVGLFLMTLKPRAKATERDLRLINVRPLRTSWFIVDMPKIKEAY